MNKKVYCEVMCKCEKCGDVFKITSEKFTECKNGCCSVRCDEYGTAHDFSNTKKDCYEIIRETKTKTYDPSYYIRPNEEISNLINKIKDNVNLYTYQSYDKNTDGTKYLGYMKIEFESESNVYGEQNTFSFYINFTRKDDNNSVEVIISKLNKVLDMYEKSQNGEFDASVSNRKELEEMFSWEREQKNRYDYTFYVIDDII